MKIYRTYENRGDIMHIKFVTNSPSYTVEIFILCDINVEILTKTLEIENYYNLYISHKWNYVIEFRGNIPSIQPRTFHQTSFILNFNWEIMLQNSTHNQINQNKKKTLPYNVCFDNRSEEKKSFFGHKIKENTQRKCIYFGQLQAY